MAEDIDQDAVVGSPNIMPLLVAVLLHIVLLSGQPVPAIAEEAKAPATLQIDADLSSVSNAALVDAIIAAAPPQPNADIDDPMAEPAAPGLDDAAWAAETDSGVAYPVTSTISLGLDYQLEEIEDLTANHIEMGTAGVDYTSHKVLVRAQWQFDLAEWERDLID